MKLTIKLFIYLSLSINYVFASKVDNITQDIAYASQDIATVYLSLFNDDKNSLYKSKLNNSIHTLEESFRELAKEADCADTKNILDFLSYSKDQIKETLKKDVSKERVHEILDYSGTLLEGAESVLKTNGYKPTKDEDQRVVLSKLTKFYMAYKLGFDTQNSKDELQKLLERLDDSMQPNLSWSSYKRLINTEDKFFPNMILILTKDLEGR